MEFSNCLDQIDDTHSQIKKTRPLEPSQIAQLKNYYTVGLTYASNALEGNTLTETETKVVIEDGITIGGKPVKDHMEALGHKEAFNALYTVLEEALTEKIIQHLHHLFYYRIDEENAGVYRTVNVVISGSSFAFPKHENVPELMQTFVASVETNRTLHPVLQAAKLHRDFVSIHPFVDGNGRTARLLMNLCLLRYGYPVAIIPPLYRQHYIETLQEAQIHKKTDAFDNFIMAMVLESQKDFIRHFSS